MNVALAAILVFGAVDAGLLGDAGLPGDAGAPAGDAAAPAGPPPPKGPPPVVKLECTPTPVRIGEPLVCTLTAAHRADVSIAVTAPAGVEAEPAEPAVELPDGRLRSERRFTIFPTSLKDVRVAGMAVVWTESAGGQARLEVPAQRIKVKSVLAGVPEPSFRTFKSPGGVEGESDSTVTAAFWTRHGPLAFHKTNWPLIIGLLVLLGGAIGVGVGVLAKRWMDAHKPEPEAWVDPRPAHVIAFEALDQLAASRLPDQGEVMQYYVRLSEIVRAYLEKRFEFGAPEMTSDEIRAEIRDLALGDSESGGVFDFLEETDLVKFADFAPSESAIDTVMKLARGLIEATRPAEAIVPKEGSA
jgi:hypothetical protein